MVDRIKKGIANRVGSTVRAAKDMMKESVKSVTAGKPKLSQDELYARIRDKAYDIYVKRGHKGGNALNDWYEAERLVRKEAGQK